MTEVKMKKDKPMVCGLTQEDVIKAMEEVRAKGLEVKPKISSPEQLGLECAKLFTHDPCQTKNDYCITCGNPIMNPGVAYGYAGPTCHCSYDAPVRRPASVERRVVEEKSYVFEELLKKNNALEKRIEKLRAALESLRDYQYQIIDQHRYCDLIKQHCTEALEQDTKGE